MTIQKRHRGGERNKYQRKPKFDQPVVLDLTSIVVGHFLRKLDKNLPTGVEFLYNGSTVISFQHDSVRAAYLLDFYPLDTDLSELESKAIKEEMSKNGELDKIQIIEDIISEQVKNILDEVDRVKSYHPDSQLTIVFGPADTIDYAGTPASPIYMFLLQSGEVIS